MSLPARGGRRKTRTQPHCAASSPKASLPHKRARAVIFVRSLLGFHVDWGDEKSLSGLRGAVSGLRFRLVLLTQAEGSGIHEGMDTCRRLFMLLLIISHLLKA